MDRLIGDLLNRLAPVSEATFISATLEPAGVQLAFGRPATMELSEWRHALSVISARLIEGERAWSDRSGTIHLICPCSVTIRGGRCRIEGQTSSAYRKIDKAMSSALQRAHSALAAIGMPLSGRAEWTGTAMGSSYERRLAELAFRAPDIQQSIIEGRQPRSLSLTQLQSAEIPVSWEAQRRAFGFGPA